MSKRTLMNYYSSSSGGDIGSTVVTPHTNERTIQPKKPREEFSHSNLTAHRGQCKPIASYEPAIRDQLKRAYVYHLIELILILPVATTSVERIFSALNIIKTDLRNKMGDEWLNDLMICYTEKD